MDRDKRHLKILSILQIILGIVSLIVTSTFSGHYYHTVIYMAKQFDDAPPATVSIVAGMFVLMAISSLLFEFCIILSGLFLAHHQKYKFCFGVAILECGSVPFGTFIGICTIFVLRRDSVKEMFSAAEVDAGSD